MILGLQNGTVKLVDHDPAWETEAADVIKRLWAIFGAVAKDIQHIGSTAIRHIKAKPVVDLIVAVDNFEDALAITPELEASEFLFRGWEGKEEKNPRFQREVDDALTHFIHIIKTDSQNWHNYINFRDYMNAHPVVAREYEALKLRLEEEVKISGDYLIYHPGKQQLMAEMIHAANQWDVQGRINSYVRL